MIKIGTRGLVGFRYKGKDKLTYNHFDSYLSGLGVQILNEIREVKDWNKIKKLVEKINLVKGEDVPTETQIKQYSKFSDLTVSKQTIKEWYCLLRETQGTVKFILDGTQTDMIDSNDFINDSLFCEWAYIINLDDMKFEIWQGFQGKKNKDRYCKGFKPKKNESGSTYYPCKMIASFDLSTLPSKDELLKLEGDE